MERRSEEYLLIPARDIANASLHRDFPLFEAPALAERGAYEALAGLEESLKREERSKQPFWRRIFGGWEKSETLEKVSYLKRKAAARRLDQLRELYPNVQESHACSSFSSATFESLEEYYKRLAGFVSSLEEPRRGIGLDDFYFADDFYSRP